MEPDRTKWQKKLLQYERTCRAARHISRQLTVSITEKVQCDIISRSLAHHLDHLIPSLKDNDRRIVFTSSCTGLMAAEILSGKMSLKMTSLYPDEYRKWLQKHPDTNYQYHIHLWSHFIANPDIGNSLYSLNTNEHYWLHTEGIMCGLKLGRGAEHLWKWGGKQPVLLKKNYAQWTS
jgi:hypothetical protein